MTLAAFDFVAASTSVATASTARADPLSSQRARRGPRPAVVLGETRAGVVSAETREGATILHLHFIDPDLRELRAAITQLRGDETDDDAT